MCYSPNVWLPAWSSLFDLLNVNWLVSENGEISCATILSDKLWNNALTVSKWLMPAYPKYSNQAVYSLRKYSLVLFLTFRRGTEATAIMMPDCFLFEHWVTATSCTCSHLDFFPVTRIQSYYHCHCHHHCYCRYQRCCCCNCSFWYRY